MRGVVLAAALVSALAACGPKGPPKMERTVPAAPAVVPRPMSDAEKALRAQVGVYYFDFEKDPAFKRYTPAGLEFPAASAKRFNRAMNVASPAVMAIEGNVDVLVFAGCVPHNCGDTAGVLAIDVVTGDVFAGLKDEQGELIIKQAPALQKVLEETSPTRAWTNPLRGK